MRLKVLYVVNKTTKNVRFLCDDASSQILDDGIGLIIFLNGKDVRGPIDAWSGAHVEVIEHRPSGDDDEAWLAADVAYFANRKR